MKNTRTSTHATPPRRDWRLGTTWRQRLSEQRSERQDCRHRQQLAELQSIANRHPIEGAWVDDDGVHTDSASDDLFAWAIGL